jgi:hypothetical protein
MHYALDSIPQEPLQRCDAGDYTDGRSELLVWCPAAACINN